MSTSPRPIDAPVSDDDGKTPTVDSAPVAARQSPDLQGGPALAPHLKPLVDALGAANATSAIVDRTGVVVAATPGLVSLLGLEAALAGRSLSEVLLRAPLLEGVSPSFAASAQSSPSGAEDIRACPLAGGRLLTLRATPIDDTFFACAFSVTSYAGEIHQPLLNSIPGMIYRCRNDRGWTFEFVSEGSTELCGYTPGEFLRREVEFGHDVIFSQDQDYVWNIVQEKLEARAPFEVEYRIILKDGSVRWAWERGHGIYSDTGELIALEGLIVDATSSQVMREELRYARYLLRAVYDASPDALVILSERGEILDVNEGFTRLFGYQADALSGFDPLRLVLRPADREHVVAAARRVLNHAEVDMEADLRHKDGTAIPVEFRLRRFDDDLGRRYIVALVRDQREQRRAKEALLKSEQRYREMFEGNHAVKLLLDPDGGEIVDANAAAAEFYGYPRDVLTTMKIHQINAGRHEDIQESLGRAAENDETHFEFRHRLKSGALVDVEVHTGPVFIDGRRMLYSIVHDISVRRRLERELRASQRMEALGRLAGGIAHDFNNLMTVMTASAALAHQALPNVTNADIHLNQIGAAARRAAELTRQLLAFGRRQVLEPQVVNLHDIIAGIDAMVEGLLSNRDIVFERDLAAAEQRVKVDVAGVEQVIINLILNARDALGDRAGRIIMRTKVVSLDEGVAVAAEIAVGPYVVLEIEDDGEGIADAHLPSIFDPFFSTKPSGTGLGLSSVYGIVKQSGGHIEVETRRGEGTRFQVYLPLNITDALSTRRPASRAAPGPATAPGSTASLLDNTGAAEDEETANPTPPLALVVEDTDVVRRLIMLLLESNGWSVIAASNGQDALEKVAAAKLAVDLLVTDIRMPIMGGQQLADHLQNQVPWLPVLFVSGWLDDVPLHIVDREGVAFMQKPPDPEELFRVAKALLHEGRKAHAVYKSRTAITKQMRPVTSLPDTSSSEGSAPDAKNSSAQKRDEPA